MRLDNWEKGQVVWAAEFTPKEAGTTTTTKNLDGFQHRGDMILMIGLKSHIDAIGN